MGTEHFFSELWSMLFVTTYHDRLAEWRNEMHPEIVAAIDEYMDTSAIDYARYNQRRMEYYGEMEKVFREYDILLSPATAVPAFDIHEIGVREINGVKGTPYLDWRPFSYIANLTGYPEASIPCGWTKNGLPVGLQITGRRFDDMAVIHAAAAFESVRPRVDRYPSFE